MKFRRKFIIKLEKRLNKLEGLISIAKKAGFVVVGGENLIGYSKKLYLLLINKNAGNSLRREMNFLAKNKNLTLCECDNLAKIVAIENCKAIGIKNKAMSESIEKCLKGD